MAEMTKRERVMAAVKGKPVDRIPVSFFNHNHPMEASTEKLAGFLVQENQKFGWDFLKANLRPSYYGEAWGCKYRFYSDRVPEVEHYVLKSKEDLKMLKKLDPTKGILGDHVKVAKQIGEALKGNVPYIFTIFSPLSVAARLSGATYATPSEPDAIKRFMQEDPEALHQALSTISQTLAEYARKVIQAGADGIFSTTTVWSKDSITEEEYKVFGRPYDLAVYDAAIQEGATINILHICRENIMLDLLSDYPVQIINYDATSSRNPTLKEAMTRTDKALWGGLDQKVVLPKGPREAIIAQVRAALEQTGGKRFFLGPGCTSSAQIPDENYLAAKEALMGWGKG